jgi:hypothetical protein
MKDIYVKSRTLKSYDKSVAEVKRMEPTKDWDIGTEVKLSL